MNIIIILFGVLIVAIALIMLIRPASIVDPMMKNADSVSLQVLAVVFRLILGAVLISYAAQSKFPLVLQSLGGISIAAAVVFAVLSRERFSSLIHWAFDRFGSYIRMAALFGLALGAFLIYAVI